MRDPIPQGLSEPQGPLTAHADGASEATPASAGASEGAVRAAAIAPAAPTPLYLRESVLQALADPVRVRDPFGRGRRPSLLRHRVSEDAEARALAVPVGDPGFLARGPFNLQQRYVVSREKGAAFCRVTGDENPIHFTGTVVPGAFTAAKLLLALEALFPGLEFTRLTVKFTAVASYGRSQLCKVRCEPGVAEATFAAEVTEEGVTVAELAVVAVPRPAEITPLVPRRRVEVDKLRQVHAFAASLGVPARAVFRRVPSSARREGGLYYYPRAFLASLPSGEMVRQLRGEGGLLNKLTLEFDRGLRVPVTAEATPLVDVKPPDVRKSAFRKILTAVRSGLGSAMRGTALVFTGGSAPSEGRATRSSRAVDTPIAGRPAVDPPSAG